MNAESDICVGRGPDLLDVLNDFKSLATATFNYKLTARVQFKDERKIPRTENENRPPFHNWDAA